MAERKADMTVKDFIRHNYRHFNAAVVVDASEAYIKHLASGGEMFMPIPGGARTAGLRRFLAAKIGQGKGQRAAARGTRPGGSSFRSVSPHDARHRHRLCH